MLKVTTCFLFERHFQIQKVAVAVGDTYTHCQLPTSTFNYHWRHWHKPKTAFAFRSQLISRLYTVALAQAQSQWPLNVEYAPNTNTEQSHCHYIYLHCRCFWFLFLCCDLDLYVCCFLFLFLAVGRVCCAFRVPCMVHSIAESPGNLRKCNCNPRATGPGARRVPIDTGARYLGFGWKARSSSKVANSAVFLL